MINEKYFSFFFYYFLRLAIEKKKENLDEDRNEYFCEIFSPAMSGKVFLGYYLKHFICL